MAEEVRNLKVRCSVDTDTTAAERKFDRLAKKAADTSGAIDKLKKKAKDAADANWNKANFGWSNAKGGGGTGWSLNEGLVNKVGGMFGVGGLGDMASLFGYAKGLAGPLGVAGLAGTAAYVGGGVMMDAMNGNDKNKRRMDRQFSSIVEYFADWFIDNGSAALEKAAEKGRAKMQKRADRMAMAQIDMANADATFGLVSGTRRAVDRFQGTVQTVGMTDNEREQHLALREQLAIEEDLNEVRRKKATILDDIAEKYGVDAVNDENLVRAETMRLLKQEKALTEELIGVGYKRHELRKQEKDLVIQTMQAEKAAAEQAIGKAKDALALKQAGIVSAQQEFGMASGADKQRILDVAGKLEKVGLAGMSGEEIEFMKGKGSIFGTALRGQSVGIANQQGFGELTRNAALNLNTNAEMAAIKAAEKMKVDIENKITIQVQQNNDMLVKMLTQAVGPQMASFRIVADKLKQEMEAQAEADKARIGNNQAQQGKNPA